MHGHNPHPGGYLGWAHHHEPHAHDPTPSPTIPTKSPTPSPTPDYWVEPNNCCKHSIYGSGRAHPSCLAKCNDISGCRGTCTLHQYNVKQGCLRGCANCTDIGINICDAALYNKYNV